MAKNDDKNQENEKAAAEVAAKAQADAEAKAAAEAPSTEGLVEMRKGGESLHVHPTTVEAHQAAGWSIA